MTAFAHPGRHRVAVLVRPGLLPMELGIVHRLFGTATSPAGEPLYEVVTCAVVPGEIRTDTDITINVRNGPRPLGEADTVIVPAADTDYEGCSGQLSEPLADAFRRIRPGTRIASICTGSFALAAVGLLDGKRATTHWKSAARFRELFPGVRLDPDVLYIDEGHVLTSAGVASGIDLCLHMIRCDHGSTVANEVARTTVVAPYRDGGQAQFIQRTVPEKTESSTGPARAWALRYLHRPVKLPEWAEQVSMSTRTFSRRFRDEVGLSPLEWLTQQRIEHARRLLEETDLPVDRVAAKAGLGTAASLRQHLHATLGVSPTAYRTTFRAAAERNAW